MERIDVTTPGTSYQVLVGEGAFGALPELISRFNPSRVVVVTDKQVGPLLSGKLSAALGEELPTIELPAGEPSKKIEEVERLWGFFKEYALDRKSLVLNLGGGTIGDVGGFAAACYMRGVPFIQLPTSLLAQVDASVGGKLAINFGGVKNLVGSFTQPQAVVIDIETLYTLPEDELISGYAEVLKHGFIESAEYLQSVSKSPPTKLSSRELVDIIAGSVRIKAAVVAEDEREAGKRKVLNFGHTFGHALESLAMEAGRPIAHGQAVSLGMLFEAKLSAEISLIPEETVSEIESILGNANLLTEMPERYSWDAVLAKLRTDKKNSAGSINWTLLKAIGSAVVDQQVEESIVASVYERF